MKKNILIIIFILESILCLSQVSLTKDINPNDLNDYGSNYKFIVFNKEIYFFDNDGIHGHELWKSDGTSEGTIMVKDINLNGNSLVNDLEFKIYKNELYFIADDGIHGQELWKTNGTQEGTKLVKDINIGQDGTSLGSLIVYKGYLYFFSTFIDYSTHKTERFFQRTDGTAEGTKRIKEIYASFNDTKVAHITIFKDELYFVAKNHTISSDNFGLYKSDGTFLGTKRVVDISRAYSEAIHPTKLFSTDKFLYFVADDQHYSRELYRSDGTNEGTFLIKDINTEYQYSDSDIDNFIEFDGKVFFEAYDYINGLEIWKTDGTINGTVLLKDLNPGINNGVSNFKTAQIYKNKLYFIGNSEGKPSSLWCINDIENTIQLVSDNYHFEIINFNNKLLFSGINLENNLGGELYSIASSKETTRLIDDINIGSESSNPRQFNIVGDKLFFTARTRNLGIELYSYTPNTLSINQYDNNIFFRIHPNPFSNIFTIKSSNKIKINSVEIFNALGKKEKVFATDFINLTGFSSGIYYLRIHSDRGFVFKKIVKE